MFRGLGIFSLFILIGLIPNSAFAGLFTHPNDAAAAAKAYHRYGSEGTSPAQVQKRYETFYEHLIRVQRTHGKPVGDLETHSKETSAILTEMSKLREQIGKESDAKTRERLEQELALQHSKLSELQDVVLKKYRADMEETLTSLAKTKVADPNAAITLKDLNRLMDEKHQDVFGSIRDTDADLLPAAGQKALKDLDDAFATDGGKGLKGQMKAAYDVARKSVIDYFRHEDPSNIKMERIAEFINGMRAQAISLGGHQVSIPGLDAGTHTGVAAGRPVDASYKRVGDKVPDGNKDAVLSSMALTMRVGTPDMVRDFIDFFKAADVKEAETAGTALQKLHDKWVEVLMSKDIGWDPDKGAPEPWMIMAAIHRMPDALQAILKGKSPAEVKDIIKTMVGNNCPGSGFFNPAGLTSLLLGA